MSNVRLIFHGGASPTDPDGKAWKKGDNENGAFYNAAVNVKKSYPQADTVVLIPLKTAADVMKKIAAYQDRAIKSLDFICHGSNVSLNFYQKKRENAGFLTTSADLAGIQADLTFTLVNGWSLLDRIDYKNFAVDARIEIHGCNAALGYGVVKNVPQVMSKLLYDNGASRGVVIGHTTKASPAIHGEKTTTVAQQDYRHGERAIYHNGVQKTTTKASGHLSDATLAAAVRMTPAK